MFDIGALELLLIGLVALIVVGPERLPRLARTAGLWVGRARRALSSVKEEIDREIKADELKEILRKQSQSRPLDTILEEGVGLRDQPRSTRSSSTSSAQRGSAGPDSGETDRGRTDSGMSEQLDGDADRR